MSFNIKKRIQDFAQDDSKRLKEERDRLIAALNQSFLDFCNKADRLAPWKDAARDYEIYATELANRTSTGVSSDNVGALYTFGCGDCGQLGHGVSDPPIEEEETSVEFPKKVKAFASAKDMRILVSGGLSNALVDSKGVWTWGCADDGALGRPGDENLPTLLPFPSRVIVTAVSLGECHGICVALSGQAYYWGSYRDKDGKTFAPTTAIASGNGKQSGPGAIVSQPSEIRHLNNVIGCASGANHTVLLTGEGGVYTFGFGDQEQLGRPVSKEFKIPNPDDKDDMIYDITMIHREHLSVVKVPLNFVARKVGCGAYHTFIISSVRCEVYGCGLNQYRQILAKDLQNVQLTQLTDLNDKSIVHIEGGEHFSLAVSTDGSVYTWGRSDQGQIGRAADDRAGAFDGVPTKVKDLPPVAQAYCGSSHVIARTRVGHVYTWGFGEMLQLGHGENALNKSGRLDQLTPKRVEKLHGNFAYKVSAGAQHSCVLVGKDTSD